MSAIDELAGLLSGALLHQSNDGTLPVTATIVMKGPNQFDVHVGERYTPSLCWDEMLGQIAALTLTGKPRYGMLTPDEHEEHDARRYRHIREREEETRRIAMETLL